MTMQISEKERQAANQRAEGAEVVPSPVSKLLVQISCNQKLEKELGELTSTTLECRE